MSADIEIINGRASFAFRPDKGGVWWRTGDLRAMGQEMPETATLADFMAASHSDREVFTVGLTAEVNGEKLEVEDRRAVVLGPAFGFNADGSFFSTDAKIVGVNGEGYVPHTPRMLLEYGDALVQASGGALGLDTMGFINGGRRWFASFTLEGQDILPGDPMVRRINIMTAFDGSLASLAREGRTRVVCANTFAAALGDKSGHELFRVKHTSRSEDRIRLALQALQVEADDWSTFRAQAEQLAAVKDDTGRIFGKVLNSLVPMPEADGRAKTLATQKRDEIWKVYRTEAVDRGTGKNGWAIVNAIGEYLDWHSQVKGVKGAASTQLRRLEDALDGKHDLTKAKVASQVLALA